MKTTFLLAACFSAVSILPGQAQEPAMTGTASDFLFAPGGSLFPSIPFPGEPQKEQPAQEQPAAQPTPTPKKPAPETAEPAALPANQKGSAAQLRMAVRVRQLKTELLADAAIQGELARAHCAKTEEGRRILMRNYYTLLYTRIEKIDPTVFDVAEKELYNALTRFEQNHIKPSILIEPGIQPLPHSRSADHKPGVCTPPATPRPAPADAFSPIRPAEPTPPPAPVP